MHDHQLKKGIETQNKKEVKPRLKLCFYPESVVCEKWQVF